MTATGYGEQRATCPSCKERYVGLRRIRTSDGQEVLRFHCSNCGFVVQHRQVDDDAHTCADQQAISGIVCQR